MLSSRPGYTWAWCRQRRGAWLCPRRRWGWSRHSRSAAPWGTCPLAGLLVCLLWACCRQHRGWACHHPGRGECSCQVLGVIDLTHWSFTSCVARYIFLIKYFFNAQYCKRHLSPSNTGWDPSEQEGVEPSAHCLPRPPPLRAETRTARRRVASTILIMAAGVWCLCGVARGPCSGYIDTIHSHNTAQMYTCTAQHKSTISDSWDFENQQCYGAEISAGKMTRHK